MKHIGIYVSASDKSDIREIQNKIISALSIGPTNHISVLSEDEITRYREVKDYDLSAYKFVTTISGGDCLNSRIMIAASNINQVVKALLNGENKNPDAAMKLQGIVIRDMLGVSGYEEPSAEAYKDFEEWFVEGNFKTLSQCPPAR